MIELTEFAKQLHQLEVELTEPQEQTILAFLSAHPECTLQDALKFAYARKFDLPRTSQLYANFVEAVKRNGFERVVASDVLEELRTGKMYVPGGRDRQGAALFVVCARKHRPKQFTSAETLRLAFYLAQVCTTSTKTQRNGVTLISDLEGVEWANFDAAFQKSIANFFQNNVPAAVKHILLYKPAWWVSMLVKMVSPFLKEKMRQRICICKDSTELQQFIDGEQLPKALGGKYEYDHEYFVRNELAKMEGAAVLFTTRVAKAAKKKENQEAEDVRVIGNPPGTVLLVDEATHMELVRDRAAAIAAIDRQLAENPPEQVASSIDLIDLLRSRQGRRSIDVGQAFYDLEHPSASMEVRLEAVLSEKITRSEANESLKRETAEPPEEQAELKQRRSSRFSQALPAKIDFDEAARELGRQRRQSRSFGSAAQQ